MVFSRRLSPNRCNYYGNTCLFVYWDGALVCLYPADRCRRVGRASGEGRCSQRLRCPLQIPHPDRERSRRNHLKHPHHHHLDHLSLSVCVCFSVFLCFSVSLTHTHHQGITASGHLSVSILHHTLYTKCMELCRLCPRCTVPFFTINSTVLSLSLSSFPHL